MPTKRIPRIATLAAVISLGGLAMTNSLAADDDHRQRVSQRESQQTDLPDTPHAGAMEARIADALGAVADKLEQGSITKEEAIGHLRGIQRRLQFAAETAQQTYRRNRRMEAAYAQIEAAAEAGEISEAQARAQLQQLRDRMEAAMRSPNQAQSNAREFYAQAQARIEEAVKSGRITEAQAKERLESLKKRLIEAQRTSHESGHEEDHAENNHHQGDVDWQAVQARLNEAVKRGAMTPEEAQQVLADMKRRMERKPGDR